MTARNLKNFSIGPRDTLRRAAERINRNHHGAVLVLERDGTLFDVVTDGDIRRALLAGKTMETEVRGLRERRAGSSYPQPVTAPAGSGPARLLDLMQKHQVLQVPLIGKGGRVTGVVARRDLLPDGALPLEAVVMAGGEGRRLRPFTDKTPKPMLPVGNKPLLERTLQRLRGAGIRDVSLTTRYKGGVISSHFGDGEKYGLRIRYIREGRPLGTAGSLRRLKGRRGPLLVVNGDVLTDMDFGAMLEFHRASRAALTVASRRHEVAIPFGVIETKGARVTGFSEKPVVSHFVSAGVYLLDPSVLRRIPAGRRFDMPDLIQRLVAAGGRVTCFPVHEHWMDIGTPRDYAAARRIFRKKGRRP